MWTISTEIICFRTSKIRQCICYTVHIIQSNLFKASFLSYLKSTHCDWTNFLASDITLNKFFSRNSCWDGVVFKTGDTIMLNNPGLNPIRSEYFLLLAKYKLLSIQWLISDCLITETVSLNTKGTVSRDFNSLNLVSIARAWKVITALNNFKASWFSFQLYWLSQRAPFCST